MVWQYRDSDPEFGLWQAKELSQHLQEFMVGYPVEVLSGKGYIEVKLAGINKGAAVDRILSRISRVRGDPDFILCIGDDRSDEDMFEVINDLITKSNDEKDGKIEEDLDEDHQSSSSQNRKSLKSGLVGSTPHTMLHGNQSQNPLEGNTMSLLGRSKLGGSFMNSLANLASNDPAERGADPLPFFSVTVGQKPSKARYFVHDTEEVSEILDALSNCVETALTLADKRLSELGQGRGQKPALSHINFNGDQLVYQMESSSDSEE